MTGGGALRYYFLIAKSPLLFTLSLAALSCVEAALVSVDFQGVGGVVATSGVGAVMQPAGGIWNVNGPGVGGEVPMVSSYGAATGVRMWTDGWTGASAEGDALYGDYLVGEVELRGLAPNESYELVLYSAANILSVFRFAGPWDPEEGSASPGPCPYGDPVLPGMEGCNYFRGRAIADAFGVISISANLGAIAGLQLDLPALSNPEPSVFFLAGVAVVVCVGGRRR